MMDLKQSFEERMLLQCCSLFLPQKPSVLIGLSDKQKIPMASLWQSYGDDLIAVTPWDYTLLPARKHHLAVLVYPKARLEKTLSYYEDFLHSFGYPAPLSLQKFLLHTRYLMSGPFPHELGIILGIRPKDILAFLGYIDLPLSLEGYWKVYGDCSREKKLFSQMSDKQNQVFEQMKRGLSPQNILKSWMKV